MNPLVYSEVLNFYKKKNVLITGNTGFKGAWLTNILLSAGAKVTGYGLKPHTVPNLFTIIRLDKEHNLQQYYEDIRNLDALKAAYKQSNPDVVFHLAAQPIVRDSYIDPLNTYTTNVNGTINILECVRTIPGCKSFLNITTDKVYRNAEWEYGYREEDPLDGYDPYSNSKSCSELVTHSYRNSFFSDGSVAISTARAGNVIGGGDFSNDRIIPDCVRAIMDARAKGEEKGIIGIRNPFSTRPYQHVLEPLFMYLLIAMKQYDDISCAGYFNVGPDDCDCVTTGHLVELYSKYWNENKNITLPALSWENRTEENAPHEANYLKLDCSRIKARFGWKPRWHIEDAILQTIRWVNIWMEGENVRLEMDREISEYIAGIKSSKSSGEQ